ncbi:MAG: EAL domain-containing protein [Gammaproteobacteria bacterium]
MKLWYWRTRAVRWLHSLGGKFILRVAGVLMITMGIIGTVNYQAQSQYGLDLLQTKGASLGHFMASVSAEAILAYDYVTLSNYVREVSQEQDVVYIVITSAEGHHLASYLNEDSDFISTLEEQRKDDLVIGAVERLARDARILKVATDIVFNARRIGQIEIGLDRSQAELMAQETLVRHLMNNIVLLIMMALSIYIVFRYSTLQPIRLLMQGAARVASGRLDTDVPIGTRDEMGKLARAFNMMMRSLQASLADKDAAFQKLQELNQSLEQRVHERTLALQTVNHELKHLALHDALTGLPNRVLIQDRLEHSVVDARRRQSPFAVFMIDLDRFKEVNDTLGHNAGDQMLVQVSQRLSKALREADTVGRLGGDEFAVIVNDVNVDASIIVASKILQAFEQPFSLERIELSATPSIGVAIYPEHGETPQALLKSADIAMYVAKQHKEGFCIYHPSKDFHSEQRLTLTSELRKALSDNQLRLYYQPKIDLQRQRLVGVEALVRWQHPEKGMINPDDFIPLAEQTGLIKPLTHWLLEKALSDLQSWQKKGLSLTVAVNLSAQNLQDAQFISYLADRLRQYETPAGRLVLEVTETALMHHTQRAIEILRQLRHLGIRLSIDDFGVGYSSFSYLKQLPVDDIKIDKSFVMDIGRDNDDAVIVESIIALAHHLGLQVVAEGVENTSVMKQLLDWGCDLAQGYYISRPLPEAELMLFLDKLGSGMNFPVSSPALVRQT